MKFHVNMLIHMLFLRISFDLYFDDRSPPRRGRARSPEVDRHVL